MFAHVPKISPKQIAVLKFLINYMELKQGTLEPYLVKSRILPLTQGRTILTLTKFEANRLIDHLMR